MSVGVGVLDDPQKTIFFQNIVNIKVSAESIRLGMFLFSGIDFSAPPAMAEGSFYKKREA